MKLKELLKGVTVDEQTVPELEIKGVATDSREVKEGDLFVCIEGSQDDGHLHALEAEMLGAAAVMAEREVETTLPQIIVTKTRRALAKIAQNYYKNPISALKLVTVVGTNGKTSTTKIIEHLLSSAGYKTGVIGTLGAKILEKEVECDLTTPDPMPFNRLLSKMRQAGVEIVIAEVSAHAIAHEKLYGLKSDICIFTNVSPDHLDFFGTFKEYSNTKLSFFKKENMRLALVNVDDDLGRKIVRQADFPVLTYGLAEPGDVFAVNIERKEGGTSFVINLLDELYELTTPFHGLHNVYNVLAAVTVVKMLRVPTPIIAENLQKMPQIEGRFNVFSHKMGKIIVDFAHTPDGLRNLLLTARPITRGRLITVFGCGGNRDRTKRPVMGDAAGRLSDVVIVTSDNPRFEEPSDIINEIVPSASAVNDAVFAVENRRDAIRFAVDLMEPGDTVIVAGKGGENYTEVKGVKSKYSDIYEVKQLLRGER